MVRVFVVMIRGILWVSTVGVQTPPGNAPGVSTVGGGSFVNVAGVETIRTDRLSALLTVEIAAAFAAFGSMITPRFPAA
jgi:hypothetical protein